MNDFLEKLKLIHKINIVFYISILLIIILISTFFISTTFIINNLTLSSNSYKEVSTYSANINENLKLLDNITIQNTLIYNEYYEVQSASTYKIILENITSLKKHEYFLEDKKSLELIQKIENRLIGYKVISNSVKAEIDENTEDGMYAVLALSTTSWIIFEELNILSNQIKKISQKKADQILERVEKIRIIVLFIVLFSFLFMFYTNKLLVKSILNQMKNRSTHL